MKLSDNGAVKRSYKWTSWWHDAISTYDLFGENFLSEDEFNIFRLKHSEIEVVENDLELFVQDFRTSLSQNEETVETIEEKR